MKVNPFYLRLGQRGTFRFDTEDPSNPGQVVSITLRTPDISTMTRGVSLMEQFVDLYIKNEAPFVAIDGVPPKLDEKLIQLATMIFVLQVEPKEGDTFDHYSVEELLALCITMPKAMLPIINKVNELSEELASYTANPTSASAMGQPESILEKPADTQNGTEQLQIISGQ